MMIIYVANTLVRQLHHSSVRPARPVDRQVDQEPPDEDLAPVLLVSQAAEGNLLPGQLRLRPAHEPPPAVGARRHACPGEQDVRCLTPYDVSHHALCSFLFLYCYFLNH